MVDVSVEVRSGVVRSRVGVTAPSIGKALNMVAGRYPRCVVRVAFHVDPECFSVHEQIRKEAA